MINFHVGRTFIVKDKMPTENCFGVKYESM